MLSITMIPGALLVSGVLMVAAVAVDPSYAGCNQGEPVVARPYRSSASQFNAQIPGAPFTGNAHWVLVDDYPEEPAGMDFGTGFYNTSGTGPKTDSYFVRNADQEGAGVQFSSCTIKAHLASGTTGPVTAYLVVKQGATQSDGNPITVQDGFRREYERPMAVNPITLVPWTSDDLTGSTIIGVKNDAGPSGVLGVGITDIILRCD